MNIATANRSNREDEKITFLMNRSTESGIFEVRGNRAQPVGMCLSEGGCFVVKGCRKKRRNTGESASATDTGWTQNTGGRKRNPLVAWLF